MARYVPGVGTFDPDLPEWLVVGKDGRLYNVNAGANRLSLVEAWTPPEGWRGGDGVTFVPEGEPAPPAPPKPADQGAALMAKLLTAMRAVIAHDDEMLRLAQQRVADDVARMQEGLRLAVEAGAAFDAVLADLQKKVNPQS